MKTNSELARVAELKVQILLAVEIPNVATSDLMPEVRKIIADTYAEAMVELDQLRRQVEFVKRKHPKQLKSGPLMLDRCQCCDGWNGKCEPDCPNNEVNHVGT